MKTYQTGATFEANNKFACNIYVDLHNQQPAELFATMYANSAREAQNQALAMIHLMKAIHNLN